jgi:hypothetical protein
MCAVSAITDHFRDKWNPITINPDLVQITRSQWEEYLALKKKMEEYDKRTKQADCVKPEVSEWEKLIEAYLIKRGMIHVNK